ncbi:MAG: 50S ribosomal protein L10 [Candidatus Geothermarchaeales archaeon]
MAEAEAVRAPPKEKVLEREKLAQLLRTHRSLLLIDLHKSSTKLLSRVRRGASELKINVRGTKNTLFMMALGDTYSQLYDEMSNYLIGPRLYIFSSEEPITTALRLSKMEVPIKAKAGARAPSDIVVERGNTGFPPGPVITVFANAKIPTKIISGAIHITKTVTAARKGDVVSPQLAEVLNKLGMTPITAKLRFVCGCDLEAREFYGPDVLVPDLAKIEGDVLQACRDALKLAVGLAYPSTTSLPILLTRAYNEAQALAMGIGYVTPETIVDLIRKAVWTSTALASRVEEKMATQEAS